MTVQSTDRPMDSELLLLPLAETYLEGTQIKEVVYDAYGLYAPVGQNLYQRIDTEVYSV